MVFFITSAQAKDIDFKQAWHQVQNLNDGLRAQKEDITRSQALKTAAKSLYLPSVDITGSYTYFDDPVALDTSDIAAALPIPIPNSFPITNSDFAHSSINVLMPVYTGGQITAAQDIRAAQLSESLDNYTLSKQNTFVRLVQYYFGVVLSEQVYAVRVDSVNALTKHLNHAIKLEEQGQIAKVERLSAQVSLDKAKVEASKALKDKEIALVALNSILKETNEVFATTSLFVNNTITKVDPFLKKTLNQHPGLKILNAKGRQARGMVDIASSKHLPKVMLYGNYTLYADDSVTGQLVPEWMVGIGIKIPIIERSGGSHEVVAAQSSVNKVSLLRDQMEQNLTVMVKQTFARMTQALNEYNSLASSEELSAETVSLRQKAFKQGLSTSLDVVDAQLFASSIRVQRLAASYKYVTTLAQLLSISSETHSFMDYQHINGVKVQ